MLFVVLLIIVCNQYLRIPSMVFILVCFNVLPSYDTILVLGQDEYRWVVIGVGEGGGITKFQYNSGQVQE